MILALLMALAVVWLLIPGRSLGVDRLVPPLSRAPKSMNPWMLPIMMVALSGLLGVVFAPLALVCVAAGVGLTVTWVMVTRLRQKKILARTKQVARAAQVVESLLGLGHIPATALKIAAEESTVLAPALDLVQMGGDPWEVMEQLSKVPGQEGLLLIGHSWRVSQLTGSSMYDALGEVRRHLEESSQEADEVAGELAGPRATGQMLSLLPLVGLAMAFGLGANPLQFFTATVVGRICLSMGVWLGCAGLIWTENVANKVSGFSHNAATTHRLWGKVKT